MVVVFHQQQPVRPRRQRRNVIAAVRCRGGHRQGQLEGLGEGGRATEAARLFEQVALAEEFPEFLTLPAYELLD